MDSHEGTSNVYDDILDGLPFPTVALDAALTLTPSAPKKDLFEEKTRAGWDKTMEARCDFQRKPRLTKRGGVWFLSLWQKSIVGRTLTDIKSDETMIAYFAEQLTPLIEDVYGERLSEGYWSICTTPKRRHKEKNFATLISEEISARLEIPFYEDAAYCQSRQRIGAVFTPGNIPEEPNVIVFDDFVTTGSTLGAMKELLKQYQKNVLSVVGINNIL